MFLYVGTDVVVSIKQVVAILDARSAREGEATRQFLSLRQGEKRITDIAGGSPKSIVVTEERVYLSPISSLTLKKRSEQMIGKVITSL
jgi:extracellular matrix regulatory protein B